MSRMREVRKILIVSLAGAGDTLMATPFISELRLVFPDAAIDVLTMQGAVARDILKGNPNVSEHLHHDFMHESKGRTLRFCLGLRRRRYDLSFTVMPQNRLEYNAVTWLIGAAERFGFRFRIPCGAGGRLLLTKLIDEKEEHLAENNLRLITEGLGRPLSGNPLRLTLNPGAENQTKAAAYLEELGGAGRWIGIHPGSGMTKNLALRRWAPEKWAALCKLLGADASTRILLFGSPEEKDLRRAIMQQSGLTGDRILEAPAWPILQTAALIERMDAFACCDTLLTHIAAAVKVPQAVIMGPTPHWSVAPYAAPHRIIRLGLPCSPCYGYSKHGIVCTNERKLQCLTDIAPEQVHAALLDLLGR